MLTSCICGQQLEPGAMRCAECQALYDDAVVVEDAWITPEPETEISEHEWLLFEREVEKMREAEIERELQARPVLQSGGRRGARNG